MAVSDDREADLDAWVASMGGFTSGRFGALHAEALEFAGPGGYGDYLDMARALDEAHAANAGKALAAGVELANARSAQAATMRAEAAAAEVLERSTAIQLAMEELRTHLTDEPWFSAGPGLTTAEVEIELRASLGLTTRPPTPYEASMPPVADLARRIGLRS